MTAFECSFVLVLSARDVWLMMYNDAIVAPDLVDCASCAVFTFLSFGLLKKESIMWVGLWATLILCWFFNTLAIFTETTWAYGNTTKIARVLLTFQFLVIVCYTGLAALSLRTCVG